MGDYHVMMQFEVAADGAALAKRLRGAGAIASWWSDTIDGAADAVGDHFQVSFPAAPSPFDLEVTSLGDSFVEWYIASQPEPWAGTTVRMEVGDSPMGDGALLMFSHRDFDRSNPAIPVVTPVWAQVMLRLKDVAESGVDNPFFVVAA